MISASTQIDELRLLSCSGTWHRQDVPRRGVLASPALSHPWYQEKASIRRATPVDYPEHVELQHYFLEIISAEGKVGRAGPIPALVAMMIADRMDHLEGIRIEDIQEVWNLNYLMQNTTPNAYLMQALSAVDTALWDLACKREGVPFEQLWGGSQRDSLQAYAQCKGIRHDVVGLEDDLLRLKYEGWEIIKLFMPYGSGDGRAGMAANLELISNAREILGNDGPALIVDAWRSWNLKDSLWFCDAVQDLNIAWLEEPLLPDEYEAYACLCERSSVPIACGEHVYALSEIRQLLNHQGCDILQADPAWIGGPTRLLEYWEEAASHDVRLLMHTHWLNLNIQLASVVEASGNALMEWPVYEQCYQSMHFLKPAYQRHGACIHPESVLGLGMELNENNIEHKRYYSMNDLKRRLSL